MIVEGLETLTPGRATGHVALLSEPLSLWGGLDLDTGAICDVSHPQCGRIITGTILVMPAARGSSSSSSSLVEAVRRGVAPAGIVLGRIDPILVIGSLVATDLYGGSLPLVLASDGRWGAIADGASAVIDAWPDRAVLRLSAA